MNGFVKFMLILVILSTLCNLVGQVILWAPPVVDSDIAQGGGSGSNDNNPGNNGNENKPGEEEVQKPVANVQISASVTPDENGQVPAGGVSINGVTASANVPEGVQMEEGATELTLTINNKEDSEADLDLNENEVATSLDVHMAGVSTDNAVPMEVKVLAAMVKGLNSNNIKLYHVENGETVEMTYVPTNEDFSAHNQFKYNPATGDVTLYIAGFSEIAMVADTEKAWDGNFDYSWYDASKTELYIASAEQLAAFGAIVGGMKKVTGRENNVYAYSDEVIQDSFKGKTVKLIANINLGDKEIENNPDIIFYPIGYYNSEGTYEKTGTAITSNVSSFKGVFDGNGHTISNFYQNTWEMKGDDSYYAATEQRYNDAMGLFGYINGGTVKNLTVDNFSSDGEYTPTGVIAAYAAGNAKFENIAITNCNPRVYNTGNGGIIGIAGSTSASNDDHITLKNITVDNSNKISALWGSWDVACGGLVGMYRGNVDGSGNATGDTINFTNCNVGAQIDVYNDVCANYQYYAYRYSGMMIGSVRHNTTNENGNTIPNMTGISAENCTVHFGAWNDYYYCELVANTLASYTHDHQMSRLVQIDSLDEIKDGDTWTKTGNFLLIDSETKTCYHIMKDADGVLYQHNHADSGEETVNGETVLKEDKQIIYLQFNNLFTGYGWGVTTQAIKDFEDKEIKILDRENADSYTKFAHAEKYQFTNNFEYTLGDLFKEASILDNKLKIKPENITVTTSVPNGSTVVFACEDIDTSDWTKTKISFTGVGDVTITIQDYYFCTPTTITVNIEERQPEEKFNVVMNNGDFLHRVGNANDFEIGRLFEAKDGVTIGTVTITVESVGETNASGSYAYSTAWESGKIKFNDTGVVKVTIKDDDTYCIPTELYLEVVEANNITSASSSNGTNVVLLSDVKVSSNGNANYANCTVYGNGFTFDVRGGMNQYNSKQGHGIIITTNATIDNLVVIGDEYDKYGAYSKDTAGNLMEDYTGAFDATNTTFTNCYIANCAAPIRANGVTIIDTTLYGGTVANLIISGGTNTFENVISVNYNDDRAVIGLGIVVSDSAAENTKIILNGTLTQYNYIGQNDISDITGAEAQALFNSMFDNSFSDYHVVNNGNKYVNAGIIIMSDALETDIITDNREIKYLPNDDVSIKLNNGIIGTTVSGAVYAPSGDGATVNNGYNSEIDEHISTIQGDYLPTFNFNLGDQMLSKDNDDDTRYLIGDKNGLTAMYPKGESPLTLDLSKLATIYKYNGINYTITAKCIFPDGSEKTGVVTLEAKGTYKIVFTVDDNIFYNKNGEAINKSVTRSYEVTLNLDLYEKSIADATITVSSSALTGEYISSGTNKKYKMYPLKAITSIMDDANKDGVLESFDFKKNIQSAVLTPEGNNAFSSPTTITITYTGGQVLTIVLGRPSGLNSPGASNGGKTFSVKTDSSNGIYLQSDGAVASSSAATGTWPLTSWSFKGTSGKVITNNTQVTINFTKPSSGCFAEGSLVTLADGTQKPIEDITFEDQLLAWDFNTGTYAVTVPSLIDRYVVSEQNVINLKFSDGTVVRMVVDHGFFDVEANKFVFLNEENVASYVGHTFVKAGENGTYENVELIGYEITVEEIAYYSIQTAFYNNCIVEGMFTLTAPPEMLGYYGWFDYFEIGEGMKYDEEKMQADIEKYGLYTYEEFADYVTYEQFMAFNGPYLKVLVGRGVVTYDQIIELIAMYVNPAE